MVLGGLCSINSRVCRKLCLSFNQVKGLGSLPALPVLQWLSLAGNGLQSLTGCPQLGAVTWLSLESNQLTTLQGKCPIACFSTPRSHPSLVYSIIIRLFDQRSSHRRRALRISLRLLKSVASGSLREKSWP